MSLYQYYLWVHIHHFISCHGGTYCNLVTYECTLYVSPCFVSPMCGHTWCVATHHVWQYEHKHLAQLLVQFTSATSTSCLAHLPNTWNNSFLLWQWFPHVGTIFVSPMCGNTLCVAIWTHSTIHKYGHISFVIMVVHIILMWCISPAYIVWHMSAHFMT